MKFERLIDAARYAKRETLQTGVKHYPVKTWYEKRTKDNEIERINCYTVIIK